MATPSLKNGQLEIADVPLTTNIDDAGTYVYIGKTTPGTATSSNSWRISRITASTGTTQFSGNGEYNQSWDNRASLTYA